VRSTRTNPSTARDGHNSSSVHGAISLLTIKEWVYTLSKASRRTLLAVLRRARDERWQTQIKQTAKGLGSISMTTNQGQSMVWTAAGDNSQLANRSHTTTTANAVATPENDAISVDNSRPASTPTSSIQRQTESFTTEAVVPPKRAVIHF
jgi:hypothetical protein